MIFLLFRVNIGFVDVSIFCEHFDVNIFWRLSNGQRCLSCPKWRSARPRFSLRFYNIFARDDDFEERAEDDQGRSRREICEEGHSAGNSEWDVLFGHSIVVVFLNFQQNESRRSNLQNNILSFSVINVWTTERNTRSRSQQPPNTPEANPITPGLPENKFGKGEGLGGHAGKYTPSESVPNLAYRYNIRQTNNTNLLNINIF